MTGLTFDSQGEFRRLTMKRNVAASRYRALCAAFLLAFLLVHVGAAQVLPGSAP